MRKYNKRVILGDVAIDVATIRGSVWLGIIDIHDGDKLAEASCSIQSAISIATMILNAVSKISEASNG